MAERESAVLDFVFSTARAYARLVGAQRLRLVEPLPGLVRLYEQLGFQLVSRGGVVRYCVQEVS